MKKLFLILLCALMCLALLSSCTNECDGHVDENGDGICDSCNSEYEFLFKLTHDESGYELDRVGAGYKGGDVVIPSQYNGLFVVEIGYGAFKSEKKLTSVVIPDSVTLIDGDAFENQTSLTSINTGKNVVTIGTSAFEGCTGLKTVVISDATQYIYASAFEGCTALESVSLGKNVKEITGSAFENCTSLKSIEIPASVEKLGAYVFHGSGITDIIFGVDAPGEKWNEKWSEGLNSDANIYWTKDGKIKLTNILHGLGYGYNVEALIEKYAFNDDNGSRYYYANNSEDYCEFLTDTAVPFEGPFDTLFETNVMLCGLRCVSGSADFIPVEYYYDVNTNKIECKTLYTPDPDVSFPAVVIGYYIDLVKVPKSIFDKLNIG